LNSAYSNATTPTYTRPCARARDVEHHRQSFRIERLVASTSGTDSDWVVKLIDVFPDEVQAQPEMGGYQLAVGMDILRGRYRESFATPKPIEANQPLVYEFKLPPSNHLFLPGHRIMVQVQSSWFPLYDRNPQTFVPNIFLATPDDYGKARSDVQCSMVSCCNVSNGGSQPSGHDRSVSLGIGCPIILNGFLSTFRSPKSEVRDFRIPLKHWTQRLFQGTEPGLVVPPVVNAFVKYGPPNLLRTCGAHRAVVLVEAEALIFEWKAAEREQPPNFSLCVLDHAFVEHAVYASRQDLVEVRHQFDVVSIVPADVLKPIREVLTAREMLLESRETASERMPACVDNFGIR
jgi:hypothetical protein